MNLYESAVKHHGKLSQIEKSIEELTELSLALQHYIKRPVTESTYSNVCEEIADVEIMLKQLGYIFDKGEINVWRQKKEGSLAASIGYSTEDLSCTSECGECKCK